MFSARQPQAPCRNFVSYAPRQPPKTPGGYTMLNAVGVSVTYGDSAS